MSKEKEIFVFQDENANYCVIVGTDDRAVAEKALRDQEDEWYGKDHEEKPIPFDNFGSADIYFGKSKKNGEEQYYWGENPKDYFDGDYTTENGFVAGLD